jgi:hypothetical protein
MPLEVPFDSAAMAADARADFDPGTSAGLAADAAAAAAAAATAPALRSPNGSAARAPSEVV